MLVKILHNGIEVEQAELSPQQEYIIGREDSCDLVLLEPKISRRHAKLFNDAGSWTIELLSSNGSMLINGADASSSNISDSDQIQIHSYSLVFVEVDEEKLSEDISLGTDSSSLSHEEVEEDTAEYLDETTAGGNQQFENYLRISYGDQSEELLKISGNHWVMGRSDTNDIQLKDSKASRKHILMRCTAKSTYLVKDMGSSNGSFFNGNKMLADKEYSIKSGDYIEIGSSRITFEQRNPNFEKEIAKIPVKVHQHAMIQYGEKNMSVGNSLPMTTGNDNGALGFIIPGQLDSQETQKKKKIIYVAIGIIVVAGIFGMTGEDSGSKNSASKEQLVKTPFQQLSEEQQIYVENSFSTAHRFFSLEQWDLSISEIQKIHRYLPKGYSNPKIPDALPTKEMLTIAETAAANIRDQVRLEEEKRLKDAFNDRILSVLEDCKSKASSMNESQVRSCLDFVFTNSPGNPQAVAIIDSVRLRAKQSKKRAVAAQNRKSLIRKGEALHLKAVNLEKKGEIKEAIAAYNEHIQSSYEDPNHYKKRSHSNKQSLIKNLSTEIERLRRKMETHFESDGQLKQCIETANKILELDSSNVNAQDKKAAAQVQLNSKLREDYQDSIFKEAHGEIEQAKKIWRRIIIRDVRNGEYYNKATIKMKKHGGSI